MIPSKVGADLSGKATYEAIALFYTPIKMKFAWLIQSGISL